MQHVVSHPHFSSRQSFLPVLAGLILLGTAIHAQVILSEFMADNESGLTDEDGVRQDWIELYNSGSTSVDLLNWALTDDLAEPGKWRFPAVTLAPKGFLVVFASGKNRAVPGSPLHTGFSLSADGEYLGLYSPEGTVVHEFSPTFPRQYADLSYGPVLNATTTTLLPPNSTGRVLIPVDDSLGQTWVQPGFDDTTWIAGTQGIGYQTAVPGFAVRNVKAIGTITSVAAAKTVLADPSAQSSVVHQNDRVVNFYANGPEGHYGNSQNFPGQTTGSDIDDFAVEVTAIVTIPTAGPWTFGVASDDGFELTIGSFTIAYPDPRSASDTLGVFDVPSPGDYELRLVYFERGGDAQLELFAAPGNLEAWNQADFDLIGDTANGGLATRSIPLDSTGLSYRPWLGTDLETAMAGRNATAYVRLPFSLPSATPDSALLLRLQYDDGFVAYLNGTEVARRNAPTALTWNSTATASHPPEQALTFEEINLSAFTSLLQTGSNLLALHGLNERVDDPGFLLRAELAESLITQTEERYFAQATPGALNSTGYVAIVADTKFSVDRGFCDAPFDLEILSATPDAVIRYTTNGRSPETLALSDPDLLTYTGPIRIAGTTTLRAFASKTGWRSSNVDTHTYLFVADIIRQSPTGQAPPGWPSSWGANVVNYGMDPDIVDHPQYSGTIRDDLKTIPSFSIVMNLDDLFNPTTGIYANPGQDGRNWERPCSVELVYPDGREGFQVNAGIRIRGGYSRSTGNPKHAFRLFFREEYGDAKLRYPLFGDQGTDTFDAIDLRTFQNYSWSFEGDSRGIFLRDQLNRDLQLAMGHPGERGDYCHLYINGQYWGLFNTCERPEASYGATYFGGEPEDYDVIKVEAGPYSINATDGNLTAWTRLYNLAKGGLTTDAAFEFVQGNNPDGTRNPAYERLVELDNLIDYMLVILYGGNLDAPISNFLGNTRPNNWYGLRSRVGTEGFRFFVHDAEHTLLNASESRIGPYTAGNSSVVYSSPQWLWQQMWTNAEFRLRVADRAQRHLGPGGVLSPEGVSNRMRLRTTEIDRAVVAESARWGDSKRSTPLTRQDWLSTVNQVFSSFVPNRAATVLNQLRGKNLYPNVAAPAFSQLAGVVPPETVLSLTTPSGTVYYTLNGTDPRLRGGAIAPSALPATSTFTLNHSQHFQARTYLSGNWSALSEATFFIHRTNRDLRITEIMYHPPAREGTDGDAFEFIELQHVGSEPLDLSGIQFTNGIRFTFPLGGQADPGQFLVLVSDPAAFTNKYPGTRFDGVYTGRLANSGETIALVHAGGAPIASVTYRDTPPWPTTPDGGGFSLVPVQPDLDLDLNDPVNWRASSSPGGSPGREDPPINIPPVWITEVLTHTDLPQLDSIEVHNPNPSEINLGGWYLTDQRAVPKKFRIPSPTLLPAGSYLVFDESDFNPTPGLGSSFNLSSYGEEVFLFSADADGNLTGFSDGFRFGAAANGVSFGRFTISTGEPRYPAQSANSLGTANAGPRVGPVVINEIQYHPAVGDAEFVELKNLTDAPVKLYDPLVPTNTWRLDGIGFTFPPGIELAPHGLLLVVEGNPDFFRSRHNIPADVPVYGPFNGLLQNDGETIELRRPDAPDLLPTGETYVPYIGVDTVRYDDRAPWPVDASGTGASLEKLNAAAYGNDPVHWRASPVASSPGLENLGNRRPVVQAAANLQVQTNVFPIRLALAATATDDGQPNPPGRLQFAWSQTSGPGPVFFDPPDALTTTVTLPGVGTYAVRFEASDTQYTSSEDVVVSLTRTTGPITIVSSGSTWSYWDRGTFPGANWTQLAFDDSTWNIGRARLGYGGDGEVTTVGYGGNASSKYITTWFRLRFSAANVSALTDLRLAVVRDDGIVVYLNEREIYRNNLPEGDITPTTLASSAIGGADETTFLETMVDPALLQDGTNVLAVEVHQANITSSDLGFDLQFAGTALPSNQAPIVNAGPDQSVDILTPATLRGSVLDDGLPIPPGLLDAGWSKISGPGSVTLERIGFADVRATFSLPGNYVLRLSASDNALSASDDLDVSVTSESWETWRARHFTAAELLDPQVSGDAADPDTDGHSNRQEYVAGTDPRDPQSVLHIAQILANSTPGSGYRLRFAGIAGRTYRVEATDDLASTAWHPVAEVPFLTTDQTVEVEDTTSPASQTRYYRITIPH